MFQLPIIFNNTCTQAHYLEYLVPECPGNKFSKTFTNGQENKTKNGNLQRLDPVTTLQIHPPQCRNQFRNTVTEKWNDKSCLCSLSANAETPLHVYTVQTSHSVCLHISQQCQRLCETLFKMVIEQFRKACLINLTMLVLLKIITGDRVRGLGREGFERNTKNCKSNSSITWEFSQLVQK